MHPCERADKGGCSDICEKDGDNVVCKCNNPTTHKLDIAGKKKCIESKYSSNNFNLSFCLANLYEEISPILEYYALYSQEPNKRTPPPY